MAIPEPGCCDGPNELLRKILLGLVDIGGSSGGPVAVSDEGVPLTASVSSINFTGGCVTASAVGTAVTVNVPCGGDVTGPAIAVSGNLASFNGVTGKIIQDSGIAASTIQTTSNLKSGAQAIGSGASTIAVVFGAAFAGAPNVVATMSRPTGGASIQVNILSDTITVAGFTAQLSGATPDATYILQWMAHL